MTKLYTSSPARRLAWTLNGILRFGVGPYRLARQAIVQRHAAQRTWELMGLLAELGREAPQRVLEIGTKQGGTLYCWARIAACPAVLISVDLPGGDFGGGCSAEEVSAFQDFLLPGQSLVCLRQDSHAPQTLEAVKRVLGGSTLDFLFIDGDHTYNGVRMDFATYAPLVRRGGLIAFHDIVPPPLADGNEVARFWAELKTRYHVTELIASHAERYGLGIGMLRWPGTFHDGCAESGSESASRKETDA